MKDLNIKIDISKVADFVSADEINAFGKDVNGHLQALKEKTAAGNDFLGWVNLPSSISEEEITKIEKVATKIKAEADIFVVVGIGGSYLGSRAVIDALSSNFSHLQTKDERKAPLVLFAGQNIGEDYLADLMAFLKGKSYMVGMISKSGTTTEPAIAFRFLKQDLEKNYGKDGAAERIFAITDKARGSLKQLATDEGYTSFEIPDDVGGRFSVLTAVGLLPIAVAGINIRDLIKGAIKMEEVAYSERDPLKNPAAVYAATRNALYNKGKKIEILANYSPNLHYITEWWKQLYGESEGKDGKGIFPAGVDLTSDLHSMGQMIQDGERNIFETVIFINKTRQNLSVPSDEKDLDKLNYIAGKRINEVNKKAMLGTQLAHIDGGVPNIMISIDEVTAESIGELIYFFEIGCGISGYLLGVNPFDQPGVEAYKKNMFALLGKPGFEEETAKLEKRL